MNNNQNMSFQKNRKENNRYGEVGFAPIQSRRLTMTIRVLSLATGGCWFFYFTRFIGKACFRSRPFLIPEISATKESELIFV